MAKTTMAVQDLTDAEITRLADELRAAVPPLDEDEQRIALAVYRLLVEGDPVAETPIADAAAVAPDKVARTLADWPGVYRDDQGDIVGFWGLAQQEFPPHRLHVDGRQLWGWCSWDTLFLPIVLDRTARVESVCAATGERVAATVGPDGIETLSPAAAVISFLRPGGPFSHDVILSFCHNVLFFSSEEAGDQWTAGRKDAFLLTLEQGFEVGRLVWEAKLGAVLASERRPDPRRAPGAAPAGS